MSAVLSSARVSDAAMSAPLAVIFGCAGTTLSAAEKRFFRDADPLGFILFARNVDNPDQVRALVSDLRACIGRDDAPVLIDQEGGRVARLRPPHWRGVPAPGVFSDLHSANPQAGLEAARLNARLIADDLYDLGIDVDCLPVLDVPQPDSHEFLRGRAAGHDVEQSIALGRATCEGLLTGAVMPVLKHIPGHGRATADSHHDLPRVEVSRADLEAIDFAPFRALRDIAWAMSAHVLYSALDATQPASTSALVIEQVIRGDMDYDGFLVSDDIGMNALSGDMGQRASACLNAGSDAVLHCNGDMDEMIMTAHAVRPLDDAACARLARGRAAIGAPQPFDRAQALVRLDALLGTQSADRTESP